MLATTFVICWQSSQTVWTQIKPDRQSVLIWILKSKKSVLIWIQTVWHSDSVPERIFWKRLILKKSQQMTTKAWKITQHAKKVNVHGPLSSGDRGPNFWSEPLSTVIWASLRQKMSSGFLWKRDSNQSPQKQRLAITSWSKFIYGTFQKAKNKDTDQSARNVQAGLHLCCSQSPEDRFSCVEANMMPVW